MLARVARRAAAAMPAAVARVARPAATLQRRGQQRRQSAAAALRAATMHEAALVHRSIERSAAFSPAAFSAAPSASACVRSFSSAAKHTSAEPLAEDSEQQCGYDSPLHVLDETTLPADPHAADPTNRAFTYFIQGSAAVCYASVARAAVHKFVMYLSASADVLALASLEVDIGNIQEGMSSTVKWRGKPVFIRHRTKKEIEAARADDGVPLRDAEKDADRVQKPEWIIVVGVCTHLGCVPINAAGDYLGWFCPCHGSHYDTAGRIRKGPAPLNLLVPEYKFLTETKVLLG